MARLFWLRVAGAATGVATAANVLAGLMEVPEFVVPDLLIGAFLVSAAFLPSPVRARLSLISANAFALGVFSVALAQQTAPGETPNPGLVIVMIVAAASMVLLAVSPQSKARA
ncbi:MAG: hypothetical protein CMI63_07470 [Parvularcula sp.]|nr:hypothetical protein [Parvularcula sp.]